MTQETDQSNDSYYSNISNQLNQTKQLNQFDSRIEIYHIIQFFDNVFVDYLMNSIFTYNRHIYIDSNELKQKFAYTLNLINNKYNNNDLSDKYIVAFKEDMSLKVFVLQNCVLRICEKEIFNLKYKKIYEKIIELNSTLLEKIYEIFDIGKYFIIVSKKIIPVNTDNKWNIKTNEEIFGKLWNEIILLINILCENNITHDDLILDNIGYDVELNNFVAFDFDKFTIHNTSDTINKNAIINSFKKSFSYNFEHCLSVENCLCVEDCVYVEDSK